MGRKICQDLPRKMGRKLRWLQGGGRGAFNCVAPNEKNMSIKVEIILLLPFNKVSFSNTVRKWLSWFKVYRFIHMISFKFKLFRTFNLLVPVWLVSERQIFSTILTKYEFTTDSLQKSEWSHFQNKFLQKKFCPKINDKVVWLLAAKQIFSEYACKHPRKIQKLPSGAPDSNTENLAPNTV